MLMDDKVFKLLKIKEVKAEVKIYEQNSINYFNQSYTELQNFVIMRLESIKGDFLNLLKISEFSSFNTSEDINVEQYYFGMVMSPTGCKLTEENIHIVNFINNQMIMKKLSVKNVKSKYLLYNGVVAAIQGTITNDLINATDIKIVPSTKVLRHSITNKKPLSMAVVKGPFSEETLLSVSRINASAIIMLGPFKEDGMPNFNEFIEEIQNTILLDNDKKKVILVPSLKDKAFFNCIPQQGLPTSNNRIYCCNNPGTLNINDHNISVTNYEIIDEINHSSISNILNNEGTSMKVLDMLCYLLRYQKTFLPIFPSSCKINYVNNLISTGIIDLYITSSKYDFFTNYDKLSYVINSDYKDDFDYTAISFDLNSNRYNISKVKFL